MCPLSYIFETFGSENNSNRKMFKLYPNVSWICYERSLEKYTFADFSDLRG